MGDYCRKKPGKSRIPPFSGSGPRGGRWWSGLTLLGPGLVLAATGVGAGDLVAAAATGSRYGLAVVWAVAVGAVLKFVLCEGLARWQLASGLTLLEGWALHLGRWVQYLFLAYLVVWSFVVGGALISACGIAAHALAPALSVPLWGAIHSLVAAAIVLIGGYDSFERLIKLFIGVMFVSLVGCAALVAPPAETLALGIRSAGVPQGSVKFILAVVGGVGGSVTLLSYGYWMRERKWEGPGWLRVVRTDLAVAYALTGIFGLAVMVLAGRVLHEAGTAVEGNAAVLQMAELLAQFMGPVGHWTFLVGFWGAVATSMLGVWQSVPYMFCDFVGLMKRAPDERRRELINSRSIWYRAFLGYLCLPTMLLLFLDRPVAVIVVYSVMGALFMPFLAGTLLYMNAKTRWVGRELRNRSLSVVMLLLCLALFGWLAITKLTGA